MKRFALALALLLTTGFAFAESKPGPRGGKLLDNESPKAEVLIESDKSLSIAFYDDAGKLVPPTTQIVSAIAELPSGKAKIEFERRGAFLVSRSSLADPQGYTVVLQIRPAASAKPQNFRLSYNTHVCAECDHPEYACTCDH